MSQPITEHLNRRRILQLTGSTTIGMLLGSPAYLGTTRHARAAGASLTLSVTRSGDKFFYNGKITGPIISASAGETIKVDLVNSMPALDDDCMDDMNDPHGENTTNLHTHGLHVSPEQDSTGNFDSDNVFLNVVPQEQVVPCWNDATFRRGKNQYRFNLPDDHPPGTHWYHAHKHGSTYDQVVGGLAGALIIKDPPGHMPDYIANAPERVIMISGGKAIEVDPDGGGKTDHTITLAPGAVERWRIINAEPRASSFVKLEVDSPDVELWQIAFDGLTLEKRVQITFDDDKDPWLSPGALAPGNRTDLMIRVKNDAPLGPLALIAGRVPVKFLHVSDDDTLALAATGVDIRIEVSGEPVPTDWPDDPTLPGPGLDPIEGPVAENRKVSFDIQFPRFTINEKVFGEVKEPMFQMKLNTSEAWRLENLSGGMHPFHIHVNPFFVTHINNVELEDGNPLRRWQDTIAIPPTVDGQPGSINFMTRFIDFTGKFVVHCHILQHEDLGMMRVVEVV